jgi:hypothetical protein
MEVGACEAVAMATIHTGTTLSPGKLELLTDWLPSQPWYRAPEAVPQLTKAGGFRLDDPGGEVGIEFLLVGDATSGTTYAVPMTYRSGPLAGSEDALIGTAEHGVLGTRWIYDGARDVIAVTQLLEFISGRVEAQHQSRSDTLDPSVGRTWRGAGEPGPLEVLRVPTGDAGTALGSVECGWTRPGGTTARGTVAVVR